MARKTIASLEARIKWLEDRKEHLESVLDDARSQVRKYEETAETEKNMRVERDYARMTNERETIGLLTEIIRWQVNPQTAVVPTEKAVAKYMNKNRGY